MSTINLAIELVKRRSITPEDAGCQNLMIQRLEAIGFKVERLPFGEVHNFWARRGTEGPLFAFAGHTDVVLPGNLEKWDSDPFKPEIRNGQLYGRGTADMKGSLAAMITACEAFIKEHPDHNGSIGFLITSDEEGSAVNGTVKVIEALEARNEKIDYCLVGEPSSDKRLGDTVKNGRRGSLHGYLTIHGKQGHIAYHHLANNPLHSFAPILMQLCTEKWCSGNQHFPATGFQIYHLKHGAGAENIIPGELEVFFNFRFTTELNQAAIDTRMREILNQGNFAYDLKWKLSGQPFLTATGTLLDATVAAVQEITGETPELSTSGGTSDGRFIAPTGAQVLELGPLNATIHQINECVNIEDLGKLSAIYQGILGRLLS
ncbi:N-succinyl-L,L-diaminopimelate desuccinylase [hydrothermal vent metagenome]|uniref:Succinyl-diaminopimelate desuccinylase n=1 Tax=hydrothermal vent metagenome TaxID=652676 RepID=A0A3B1B1U1_9ZZZZ